MSGSYEFKQQSYIVHERRSWDYASDDHEDLYHEEVSSQTPSIHKMLQKPSSDLSKSLYDHPHHDNMVFNGNRRGNDHESHEGNGLVFNGNRGWDEARESRGWCGTTHHMNRENFTVKKNEHQALGPKTTILRPPLGSISPPSNHEYRHQALYEGSRQAVTSRDERQYFRDEVLLGSDSVSPPGHNTKYGSWQAAEANREERQYSRGEGPLGSVNPTDHKTPGPYGSRWAGATRDERQYFRDEGLLGSDSVSPPGHNTKYGSRQAAAANRDERQYFRCDQGPLGSVKPPNDDTTYGSWQAGANRDERQYSRGEGPLGSVNPTDLKTPGPYGSRRARATRDERQYFLGEGPTQDSMSNSSNKTKRTEAPRKYGHYDHQPRLGKRWSP